MLDGRVLGGFVIPLLAGGGLFGFHVGCTSLTHLRDSCSPNRGNASFERAVALPLFVKHVVIIQGTAFFELTAGTRCFQPLPSVGQH